MNDNYDDDDDDDDDENLDDADDLDEDDLSADDEDDLDSQFARVEAILGKSGRDMEKALNILLVHLRANLRLPCEVTGIEDFRWEEPYAFGGLRPAEYKKLKKTQPSYRDRYQLIGIDCNEYSEWMLFSDDLSTKVQRVSDGKKFTLGLSELKAVDKRSPNYQLLDDYSVWFVNSR